MGIKLHVDAIGNHPKVFFLSWSLFSIDRLAIFNGKYRVGRVLPKFVATGSDTKAQGFVYSALKEIRAMSKHVYQVSDTGHCAVISCNPVILSGDGAVKTMFTGCPAPTDSAAAKYEVCFANLFVINTCLIVVLFLCYSQRLVNVIISTGFPMFQVFILTICMKNI